MLNFFKSSYKKIKQAFVKTGSLLGNKIRTLFEKKIDHETLESLEKIFYEADLGVQLSIELTEKIKSIYRQNPSLTAEALLDEIRKEIIKILTPPQSDPTTPPSSPYIIMVVGVNGNGKTTSVAKLAKKYQEDGKKVLLAAADTFRAAAGEQLEIWANRLQIDIVKGAPNSDPAAVTFDAVSAGKAREMDVVIIDTAGRLHTNKSLMQELDKIKRSCKKIIPSAPHDIFLVLDATTGQNAITQAKTFSQFTPISGLILTKLDGSSKGGIAISIQQQLAIPIKYIGVGENIEDLELFDSEMYVNALFE